LYLSCRSKELADYNPDHAFLGKKLDYLGAMYTSLGYFNFVAQYYLYAATQFHKADLLDKAKNSLYNASILANSVKSHDEPIENKSEGTYKKICIERCNKPLNENFKPKPVQTTFMILA